MYLFLMRPRFGAGRPVASAFRRHAVQTGMD